MKKQIISTAIAIGIMTTAFAEKGNAQSFTYEVKKGETLYSIAAKNDLTVQQLMEFNGLNSATIYVGQVLKLSSQPEKQSSTYTVRSGDTLYSIANLHRMSIADLKSMNQLTSNTIYVGQVLKTAGKITEETPSTIYSVKNGDTLWSIAQKHHLTVDELKSINDLSTNMISVGQKLKVSSEKKETTVTTYTVKAGDTLYSISKKFHLTVNQLKSFNQLNNNTIHVGQILILQKDESSKQTEKNEKTIVERLIAEGKKYIGTPYKWGGTSPAGFDCSGFLHYVFKQQGITIPRTVETIWQAAKSVSSPKRGDLVFFETYKDGPSHAGIYLGNNQFLHSGTSTGVTISNLKNSYWNTRYLGAKSILK